jgi:hypothetical protein
MGSLPDPFTFQIARTPQLHAIKMLIEAKMDSSNDSVTITNTIPPKV